MMYGTWRGSAARAKGASTGARALSVPGAAAAGVVASRVLTLSDMAWHCRRRPVACRGSAHAAAHHADARVCDVGGQIGRGEPPGGRRVFVVHEEMAAEAQAVLPEAFVDDAGRGAKRLQQRVARFDAAALCRSADDGERGGREASARGAHGVARLVDGADIPAAPSK